MWTKKSFTLVEILVVIIVVGILAAIGLPNYSLIKEKALDKEAKVTVLLLRSAEEIYKMEHGIGFPLGPVGYTVCTGNITNINLINTGLKLSLPGVNSSWLYCVANNGLYTADRSRNGLRISPGRSWVLNDILQNPICNGTCY